MKKRTDLARVKRQEICNVINSAGIESEKAEQLLKWLEDECLLEIYPPEEPEYPMQYMTIFSPYTGKGRGATYKSGNIIINMRKSILHSTALLASSAATLGAISCDNPGIAALTILSILLSLPEQSKISLAKDEAFILAVLWEERRRDLSVEQSLLCVNQKCEECNKKVYNEEEYADILDNLVAIKSIEIVNDTINLKERIQIKYH